MSPRLKFLSIGYLTAVFGLFFYSFTQVDLSLTLSQASWWQTAQKFFQHIGYFNRPLSTAIYVALASILFVLYIIFIKLAKKKKIDKKVLWTLIILSTIVLTFSYNAFSYDLFNYIFDAKIVTFYHQNPYAQKALDYLGDPMLTFMHWTHRYYPYGPTWLGLTIPLSYLGFNFFLPTFFLFKIFNSLYFLGTVFFIEKILKRLKGNEVLGLILFALNPLVLVESLVSSHNDTAMVFLAVLSIYLLFENKKILSFGALLLSIGVKFATFFLFPAYIYFFFKNRIKSFSEEKFLLFCFFLMFAALMAVSIRTLFQPWYLLYIIPFAALLPERKYSLGVSTILSFFALAQYVPFLYKGDWNNPVPQTLVYMTITGFVIFLIYVAWGTLFNPKRNDKINV